MMRIGKVSSLGASLILLNFDLDARGLEKLWVQVTTGHGIDLMVLDFD